MFFKKLNHTWNFWIHWNFVDKLYQSVQEHFQYDESLMCLWVSYTADLKRPKVLFGSFADGSTLSTLF